MEKISTSQEVESKGRESGKISEKTESCGGGFSGVHAGVIAEQKIASMSLWAAKKYVMWLWSRIGV